MLTKETEWAESNSGNLGNLANFLIYEDSGADSLAPILKIEKRHGTCSSRCHIAVILLRQPQRCARRDHTA
jgi:hypothetical protein